MPASKLGAADLSGTVITQAVQLRGLTLEQAAREIPVRLRGVVTFHDSTRAATFIHDDSDSTFVWVKTEDLPVEPLTAGTVVEVEGVSAPGDFHVCVSGPKWTSAQLRVIGRGELPAPLALTANQFMEPTQDQRWVEVEAVISQVTFEDGYSVLELDVGRWRVKGVVAGRATGQPISWQLVQVPVRIRGVVGSIFNSDRQLTGRILCIPGEDAIHPLGGVLSPRATEAVLQTPATLLRTDRNGGLEPVRVLGVVSFLQPGEGFYIRGEDGSLWVQTAQQTDLFAGAEVEVTGLPMPSPFRPFIQGIQVRQLNLVAMPTPIHCRAIELFSGRLHGELVCLEAELVEAYRGAQEVLILQLREGNRILQARMTLPGPGDLPIAPGSRLRVTGICEAQAAHQLWTPQVADRIEIRMRSLADAVVLAAPRWWNMQRLLAAVGVLLAGLLVVAGWVVLLRRRVIAQTQIIRQKLERETLWEERSRIAHDLHDDVGASLTQISNLGELAVRRAAQPEEQKRHLTALILKARQTVQALDEIVWTISPRNDALPRSGSYFSHAVRDLLQGTDIRCRLLVPDELPEVEITSRLRHHLLLAVKEAVRNVIKHSRATELRFQLAASERELTLTIADDGQGFDPETADSRRNGMSNLADRLREVGGRFEVQTQPGQGTTVRLTVPLGRANS
ncbi:MAG: sensor histidine kinase [Verrucomicrobia bacterium]|nr:sensor histidine kinase [Verrucomicrobiota bacterium]